ncbi:MAG: hypothetical protein ACE5K7_06870, partial [Phycisphaerae bacterium]
AMRPNKKRRLALGVAFLAITLLAVGLWLGVQQPPSWYQPAQIEPGQYQTVRDDLEEAFNSFNLAVQRPEAFSYSLDQRRVNSWIAARQQIWPGLRRYIPAAIEQPMVRFHDGRIVVAGRVHAGPLRTVLSVRLAVEVIAQGLWVRIERCQLGWLPVPQAVVRRVLSSHLRHLRLADQRTIAALLDGLALPNEFQWRNGRRHFRLQRIDVQDARLLLQVQPYQQNDLGRLWQ